MWGVEVVYDNPVHTFVEYHSLKETALAIARFYANGHELNGDGAKVMAVSVVFE